MNNRWKRINKAYVLVESRKASITTNEGRSAPITTKLSGLHQQLILSLLPSPSETVIKRFAPTHTVNCKLCMHIQTHHFLLFQDNVKKISAHEYQSRTDITPKRDCPCTPGECITIHEVAFSIDKISFLFDALPVELTPNQIKKSLYHKQQPKQSQQQYSIVDDIKASPKQKASSINTKINRYQEKYLNKKAAPKKKAVSI